MYSLIDSRGCYTQETILLYNGEKSPGPCSEVCKMVWLQSFNRYPTITRKTHLKKSWSPLGSSGCSTITSAKKGKRLG